MSLTVTILGCGASSGVPMIGCLCAVCRSTDPKNKRLRPLILIEEGGRRLLVDVTPDLRQQALANGIERIDAVLFTHAHADHCHGIDDLRPFNYVLDAQIPAYADPVAVQELLRRFGYAFKPSMPEIGWFRPSLALQEIDNECPSRLALLEKTEVELFPQRHGSLTTFGLRVGPIAYSTDVNRLTDEAFECLRGVEVWIVDCLRHEPSPSHAHLALTLEWIAQVKPRRAILTHMGHDFDYDAFRAMLPDGVEPGYDGLRIEL